MAKHVDVERRETLRLSLQLFCLNTAFPSEEAYSVFDGSEAGQGSASWRATGWGRRRGLASSLRPRFTLALQTLPAPRPWGHRARVSGRGRTLREWTCLP